MCVHLCTSGVCEALLIGASGMEWTKVVVDQCSGRLATHETFLKTYSINKILDHVETS